MRALVDDEGKSVIRFNPLGKRGRPPPEGTWFWALRFDTMSLRGREMAEDTRNDVAELTFHNAVLRMDRGSLSGLEKQLRELTLAPRNPRKARSTQK